MIWDKFEDIVSRIFWFKGLVMRRSRL